MTALPALVAPWAAHAAAAGEHPALLDLGTGETWSWARLAEEAARRAKRWRAAGLRPGDRVALCLPAGPEWVASVWAAWLCSAVWSPLPPGGPEERNKALHAALDPRLTVSLGGTARHHETLAPCPPDAAYLVHTSGSTGVPKGVLVGAAGLPTLWAEQARWFGTTPDTRASWMLSPAFDASVSDIGVALTAGACLAIVPPGRWRRFGAFARDLAEHGIGQIDAPPSWLGLWAHREPPEGLRCVVAGGEPTPSPILAAWSSKVRWVNVYGPTEATVCTSAQIRRVAPGEEAQVTLGEPLPGVRYRLQEPGRACPDGAELAQGELWIGGPAVALGYWNDPVRTAERFAAFDGTRWFRTGDAVIHREGAWIYEGRLDRQIKRRGQMLHLDEVETVLAALPGVRTAVAFVDRRDRLAVAVDTDVPTEALRAHAAERLPMWGRPQRWVRRTDWPRTATGKVDKRALAQEDVE